MATVRPFMTDYVMNEPSPKCLVRTIDTALLLKKLDCAPLMDHYQFLQRRGEVKHVPPAIVQTAVLVTAFCEREIVQQI